MHILFLTDNFPPEVNAPATRTFEHCQEWVNAGHKVTVITCAPNFPKGRLFEGYRNRLWQQEEMERVRVIRVWTYITANEGFGRRVADYLSYMISATLAALFVRKPDIIVGTSPQFFTACAAWMVSLLKRKPWVFELRDLWPESIRAVGVIENSRLIDMLERLELFLYRQSTAVISVTNSFRENLIGRGIAAAKIHVVTNGASLANFRSGPGDAELKSKLGLSGKFVCGYIGTLGMAHGLDTILDAAKILKDDPNLRIVILGDGADRARLQARIALEGIDNLLILDSVPKDQVARHWSVLDLSIIHLRRSALFKNVIPSKMFECMAMGLPILHGVEGESAEIVEINRTGLLFEPENAQALADSIILLRKDSSLRSELSRNGPKAARMFDRSELALRMLDRIEACASL